jgi:hypothetical protein
MDIHERGLEKLEELLNDEQYRAIQEPIQELQQMIREERLYGPAPATSQKRFKAVHKLNLFLLAHFENLTFNDLCRD